MLGELEENFKSLEQGSKDMVTQVIKLIGHIDLGVQFLVSGKTIGCTEYC